MNKDHLLFIELLGDSANAVPHYQKLRTRVTHIWGNRKRQPNRSAMVRPLLGGSIFLIIDAPVPGKYELVEAHHGPTSRHKSFENVWKHNFKPILSLCVIIKKMFQDRWFMKNFFPCNFLFALFSHPAYRGCLKEF